MQVITNPGTGPVYDGAEKHAVKNIKKFIKDLRIDDVEWVRVPDLDYADGRFAFLIWRYNRCHEIQMPGLHWRQVRYLGKDGQNIWDFPRLYVDGASWVWKYAISQCFYREEEEC